MYITIATRYQHILPSMRPPVYCLAVILEGACNLRANLGEKEYTRIRRRIALITMGARSLLIECTHYITSSIFQLQEHVRRRAFKRLIDHLHLLDWICVSGLPIKSVTQYL